MARTDRYFLLWKRIPDIVISAVLLMLLAFPMLCIAVLIRCETAGGAIFRQKRLGRGLRPFTILKFRTMRTDAPHDLPSAALQERERYLTRIGRVLRRSGLDELPQLWNVLWGDMSLIGPRPVIPEERALHRLRAMLGATGVRPGITGLAQVTGRDENGDGAKAYYDALYARFGSWRMDLQILFLTVRTLISGRGCN